MRKAPGGGQVENRRRGEPIVHHYVCAGQKSCSTHGEQLGIVRAGTDQRDGHAKDPSAKTATVT